MVIVGTIIALLVLLFARFTALPFAATILTVHVLHVFRPGNLLPLLGPCKSISFSTKTALNDRKTALNDIKTRTEHRNVLDSQQSAIHNFQHLFYYKISHSLTGNQDSLTGNQDYLTGNQDSLTGNQDSLTGNQPFFNRKSGFFY